MIYYLIFRFNWLCDILVADLYKSITAYQTSIFPMNYRHLGILLATSLDVISRLRENFPFRDTLDYDCIMKQFQETSLQEIVLLPPKDRSSIQNIIVACLQTNGLSELRFKTGRKQNLDLIWCFKKYNLVPQIRKALFCVQIIIYINIYK